MDTTTATITTIGVIALAAITYRLFLNSAKADPAQNLDDDRILATNDNGAIDPAVYGLITHPPTLSEATTRPMETDELHRDYHQEALKQFRQFEDWMAENFSSPSDRPKSHYLFGGHKHVCAIGHLGYAKMMLRYREGHDALTSDPAYMSWVRLPGKKSIFGYRLFSSPGRGRKAISIIRSASAGKWVNE